MLSKSVRIKIIVKLLEIVIYILKRLTEKDVADYQAEVKDKEAEKKEDLAYSRTIDDLLDSV